MRTRADKSKGIKGTCSLKTREIQNENRKHIIRFAYVKDRPTQLQKTGRSKEKTQHLS